MDDMYDIEEHHFMHEEHGMHVFASQILNIPSKEYLEGQLVTEHSLRDIQNITSTSRYPGCWTTRY